MKHPFVELLHLSQHCPVPVSLVQEVIQKFEKLKIACQELQRDVTMRRCLARKDEIQRLQDHIEGLQQQLEDHFTQRLEARRTTAVSVILSS